MRWPPEVGQLLPRADEAFGVRYKLATYSLAPTHRFGGPKAKGFEVILGITMDSIDYLVDEIYDGILKMPISSVRPNPLEGFSCVVDLPLRGIGARRHRIENLRRVWHLCQPDALPRLANAFLKT
jgi:hypothetical protein